VVYGGPRASIPDTIPLSQADLAVSGATASSWLGTSVFAGDLNRDGTDDLLMGAIGIDPDDADGSGSGSTAERGAAYALFGGSSLSGTVHLSTGNPADLTVLGAAANSWLGRGLAAGDLNQRPHRHRRRLPDRPGPPATDHRHRQPDSGDRRQLCQL